MISTTYTQRFLLIAVLSVLVINSKFVRTETVVCDDTVETLEQSLFEQNVSVTQDVTLSGDVDSGHANISIKFETAADPLGDNTKMILNNLRINFNDIIFAKNSVVYDLIEIPRQASFEGCSSEVQFIPKTVEPVVDMCEQNTDMILIVDSSASIEETKFEEFIKPTLKNVTRRYTLGLNNTRQAAIVFAQDSIIEYDLESDIGSSNFSANNAISLFPYFGQFSDFSGPIDEATIILHSQGRSDVAKTVVLFVDGRPNLNVNSLAASIKRIQNMLNMCLYVVATDVIEGTADEQYLREMLECPELPLECEPLKLLSSSTLSIDDDLNKIVGSMCECAQGASSPTPQTSITSIRLKIKDAVLADFGTNDELEEYTYQTIFYLADDLNISPNRVAVIDIEDSDSNTLPNVISSEFEHATTYRRRMSERSDTNIKTGGDTTWMEISIEPSPNTNELTVDEVAEKISTELNNESSSLSKKLRSLFNKNVVADMLTVRSNENDFRILNIRDI